MNKLRKFLALPANDKTLLLEAVFKLGTAQLFTKLMPFHWIARNVGRFMMETPHTELPPAQLAAARKIRWSIRAATRHVPWQAVCLQQSLAAKMMLKRRSIPATLYFGVRKSADDAARQLDAHAWVRAGATEITPSQTQGDFTVVAMLG